MKNITIITFIAVITIMTASAALAQVPAENTSSITSIPPKMELKLKPGQTIQELVKIRNESATGKTFETEILNFIVTDDRGTPITVDEEVSGRWSAASWMSLNPSRVFVPENTTKSFALMINVPVDALPGGHYAMIIYRPVVEGLVEKNLAVINQEVTTLVNIVVEGPITEDAILTRFETDKKLEEYGPVKFFVEIKNLSDSHIRPKTKIVVENVLLSKVVSRPIRTISLQEANIFPEASRQWEDELPGKWHFGKYRATLTAAYGEQGKALTGVIYFWIVPYRVAAAVLIVLLVALAVFLSTKRRKPRKKPASS